MSLEAIEEIIRQLREKIKQAQLADDDDLSDQMIAVRKSLKAWDGGGALPHATELRRWGIALPGVEANVSIDDAADTTLAEEEMAVATVEPDNDQPGLDVDVAVDAADEAVVAATDDLEPADVPDVPSPTRPAPPENPFDLRTDAPETAAPPTEPAEEPALRATAASPREKVPAADPVAAPVEPEQPAWDPDDDLQEAFDAAQALLNAGRFRAALDAFDVLRLQASGRLDEPSEAGYEMAAARLNAQLSPLIERAQRHAEKQADDFKGQRGLWGRVLEIDPQNETANEALRELEEREAARAIDREVTDARQRLERAVAGNDYNAIVALLGEVEGMAGGNRLPARQRELDELVRDVKAGREQVRDYLGIASTKAGSEDYKGAYIQARVYVDQGVPVALDERGVFGPVGEEYDTVDFLRKARQEFITWSRSKALERKAEAVEEAKAAPERALRTLAEARNILTDDTLTREDREILTETLREIEKVEAEVNERLVDFRRAEVLVDQAPLAEPRERLRLLREAQTAYADFPDIAGRISRALDDVASVVAGELDNRLVAVRQSWEDEHFDEALAELGKARKDATDQVPDYAPDSKLAERLDAKDGTLRHLEDEIIRTQSAHNRLIEELRKIDALLVAKNTEEARRKLNALSDEDRRHRETQRRFRTLSEVQDVSASWPQGQEAYVTGRWSEAIPLLERVAGSAMPEKGRAALLLNRARAAQSVEDGLEEEGKQEWKEALKKYSSALLLFDAHPIDDLYDPAETFRRRAEDRRAALDEQNVNDVEVQGVIDKAKGLLQTAGVWAEARKSAEARVKPIGLFAAADATLMSLLNQNMRTTLISELETQLYKVRSLWRATYLDGLRAAHTQRDEGLLRKALALGRTLEANGLLIEARDKEVFRNAQEELLDLELLRLKRGAPTSEELQKELDKVVRELANLTEEEKSDPERIAQLEDERTRLEQENELLQIEPIHATALIAANRRERWRVADRDREALRNQYLSAVRERVGYQLIAKRHEGLKPALEFLAREVDTPELYEDEYFFAQLIELCWQAGEWREADRRASSLASRANLTDPALKSELWLGLIAMARHLSAGDRERFEAEWDMLRDRVNDRPDYLTFLDQQKQKQIDWRVRELLDRAEKSARGAKPNEWLDALLAYAEADDWSPRNAKVAAGLKSLGVRVWSELDTRIPAAQRFSLAGMLEDNLRSGQEQLHILSTIYSLAELLRLDNERKEELASAIETLKKRLEPGQKVHANVSQAQEAIDEALVNPQPFQSDEGGWSFEKAESLLTQAQAIARGGDRALQGHVQSLNERLHDLINRASTLNDLVREFRQATANEDFDGVINVVNRLKPEWQTRYQSDGFRGLEQLTKISYPLDKRSPRNLDEYANVAMSQKENLAEWQDWANRCQKAYDALHLLAERYTTELAGLVKGKSLAAIVEDCDRVGRLYAAFADVLAQRPPKSVNNRKAQQAAGEINQTKITAAEAYDRRATELKREAEDALRELDTGLLHRLRGAINQLERSKNLVGTRPGIFQPRIERIPPMQFETAKGYIDKVNAIDPHNAELKRLRDQYDEIKKAPGGMPQE